MVYGQFPVRTLRQELERYFGLALAYHEVYNDQALEYDCPCRITKAVREGAEYLSHAGFTSMRRDEDMLDILGLGSGKLCDCVSQPRLRSVNNCRMQGRQRSEKGA
jgi:hypothetical protein